MPSIVRTSLELHLWSQAQTNNEWATTKFWEHKIRGEFPGEDDWVVASQQPPTDDPGDRRRVELVVDKWTGTTTSRLFIFEAKKHHASQTEIDELEHQAYEACITHLKYTQREHMYAQTVIGTLARLWVAHVDEDYLVPWQPMGASLGDKSSYIEAHGSEGHLIRDSWAYMKRHLEMSKKDLRRLRENVRSVVESSQPSASYSAASTGSGFSPNYPYAASASASGMSSGYTVPPVQHPSTYSASSSAASYPGYSAANPEPGPDSGDTHPINSNTKPDTGRISSPSEGASPEHETQEHYPLVPNDAIYVDVEVEAKKEGDTYHFFDGDHHYRKKDSDWEDRTVEYNDDIHDCVLCTRTSSGKSFWAWSLRDLKPYLRGKERRRK